ncbi:MAG: HAMP domain-containing histidine kinase [Bacteroidales bacterium]|nr:HAMP domain-containing histidine kinase [Bacteroidales bacterium]
MNDDEKYQFIDIIFGSSKQLNSLLENLLQWARAQSGSISFNPEPISPGQLADSAFKLLQLHADKKKITLINQCEDITIYADQDMISTVIRNLVSNAIKFSPRDKKIMVSASQSPKGSTIVVEDQGIGIAPEIKSQLFKLDRSISTPGTEKETGTGLGLILCQEFIEKHGGSIWVDSEPGKGSRFYIELPKNTTA